MARTIDKLTTVFIRQTVKSGWHADGGGLYLKVTKNGSKSFAFRYTLQGRSTFIGLGSVKTITLGEAREQARAARKLLIEGVDPGRDKRAQKSLALAVPTFAQACDRYIAAKRSEWSNKKHAETWESSLRIHMYPTLGNLRMDSILTGDVVKALEKIWTLMPETASRTRQRTEKVFDWCQTAGYRTASNPARWRGCLEHLLPKLSKVQRVENQPALDWRLVPEFMKDLRSENTLAGKALKLAILCCMRSGEVRLLKWDEVNITEKTITIPGCRMKAGRDHRIPLSPLVLKLLRDLERVEGEQLVFPGRKPGEPMSDATMLRVVQRINEKQQGKYVDPKTGKPIVVHGFRASFKTWATEATAYPRDLVESALAHTIANKTEASYQRGDSLEKRMKMMGKWAAYAIGQSTKEKILGSHES